MVTVTENSNRDGSYKQFYIRTEHHWCDIISIYLIDGKIEIGYSSGGCNSGVTASELAESMKAAWNKASEIISELSS